jgi:hypothetical protein
MMDKRKQILRNWMVATTRVMKGYSGIKPPVTVNEISFLWEKMFGIKMTDRWVVRALYGKEKKGE